MKQTDLKSLSDDELLVRLSTMLKASRRVESVLVAHLAEVDARRLYAREGMPSMFVYCTDVLHLSEAEAYLRIAAARASRRFPVLLTMLEDGRLHLSAIGVLAPHLTDANCDELLARATHKSKREVKELVAAIAPKPDVPPRIRKVPERRTKSEEPAPDADPTESVDAATENRTSSQPSTASGRSCPDPAREHPAKVKDEREQVAPLSPARYKVQFTASAELRHKLNRLSALMPDADLASVIESAVTEKLERLEAKRYGTVKKPRKTLEDADTAPGTRGISAPVKRFVWRRGGGQCTFIAQNGRRCPERHQLQFHHDEPFALGGDRSADNVRLLCAAHNAYMAEKDYGKQTIDTYRGGADRVHESAPSFELRPDAVRCNYGSVCNRIPDTASARLRPGGTRSSRQRRRELSLSESLICAEAGHERLVWKHVLRPPKPLCSLNVAPHRLHRSLSVFGSTSTNHKVQ